ncbi:endo alpha-1,4 polygalactosaminidase [Litorihabitans aurantiacus]|uniref:Glycoside-hydrolase family GH114 TIM-barrel domain-containing protein n=1 Tax=Litorihabitans aurantiacus TaxID=1930061 RepID=A0AA37XHI6_9MICO|nr:endo alpha-1,4 polygalactosaminidase [Litorihabitans aurantiacus]GMA33239.1 hypothetical protein GCM10025875_32310 [Litorihabitans aurantiacus]
MRSPRTPPAARRRRRPRRGATAAATGALVILLTACGAGDPDPDATEPPAADTTATSPALPPTTGTFDYQLGDAYGEAGEFDVVGRDVTADPLPDAYNVCYVNGFQTQPGTLEDWRRDAPDALLRDASGAVVTDPDWPDEVVLDPSDEQRRAAILAVVGPQVSACAERGFDAVELDNLDTFLRFDGVDADGAMTLATAYADLAHGAGLAVGQKNAADVGADAREVAGFDFAVVEECARYDECGAYRDVYGEHVLQIEYDDGGPDLAEVCDAPDRAPLTILRDRLLVGPDDPSYVREQCD